MKLDKYVLFFVLFIAIFIKLKNAPQFIGKESTITGYDAYYYARLSDEFLKNQYTKIDTLRDVPDFLSRPDPVPLIVYIGSFFSKIFPKEYVFAFIPPLFSVLFIIPLFLWLKRFSNSLVFISGALVGVTNIIYFSRTYIGKYDTDFLILFFVFSIVYLFVLFFENIKDFKKILINTFLIFILFFVFLWFYNKPEFSMFFLFSFLLGFIGFSLRKPFNISFLYKALPIFILFFIFSYAGIQSLLGKAGKYFFKEDSKFFLPYNPEEFVRELQPISLYQFADAVAGNMVIFVFSIIGLIFLFKKYYQYLLPFVPFMILGLVSLKAGSRFVMYIAPFIGLGFGYFVYMMGDFVKKYLSINKKVINFSLASFVFFFSINPTVFFVNIKPVFSEDLYKSLKEAKKFVPEDSYLWMWWDYGYPIEYVLRRGTYVDNGNKDVVKLYAIARSLVSYDEKETYQFISYLTNHKRKDYRNLSYEEFIKEVRSYSEKPKKEVFLPFFEKNMFYSQFYMIGMIGSGINNFNLPAYKVFQECKNIGGSFICSNFFKINKDLEFSFIKTTGKNIYKIFLVSDRKRKYMNWNQKGKLVLQVRIINNKAYFAFVDKTFYKTVFNRMYFLKEDFQHFQLVYDSFPMFVLYKVKLK